MVRIEKVIEIEAPIEKVFAFWADPKKFEKLLPEGMEGKIEVTSEGPIGVGSTYSFSGIVGGQKMETETEFVEWEENRRMVSRQIKGVYKRSESGSFFEATDKGTKVTETVDYELLYSEPGKGLDDLKVRKDIEASFKAGLEKAKEILEKG